MRNFGKTTLQIKEIAFALESGATVFVGGLKSAADYLLRLKKEGVEAKAEPRYKTLVEEGYVDYDVLMPIEGKTKLSGYTFTL